MAKNIYNNNKPSASVSMNGFDGGQFQTYSMKAGIANPCFFLATNPKFKCRINVQNFMMAEYLRQNAFLRAKQNIDFFFVPYRQLSHLFPALYYGRNDIQSQIFNKDIDDAVPLFSLLPVLQHLHFVYALCKAHLAFMRSVYPVYIANQVDESNSNASISFDRFVRYVVTYTYNNKRNQFGNVTSNFMVSAGNIVFYLYTCQHMSDSELTDFIGDNQDLTWRIFFEDLNYNVEDCLRVLDMLGYGNYFADFERTFYDDFFQEAAINFDKVIQNVIKSNPTTLDDVSNLWLSLLGILAGIQFSTASFVPNVRCNALNLLAYQKIFDNVYRNSILHEPFKFGEPLVSSFNADAVDSLLDTYYGIDKFIALCLCPYYIQHRRNITNGLWNSPAFGGNVNVPLNDEEPSYDSQYGQSAEGVSIPDLRLGFAMQQFRERLLRCGTREKDLLRGLFGTKSRYISDEYVYYIGSFDGVFNVNTVQDVSGENLGRLGGNIMSSVTGHQLEFSTEEFGVIIGIHTVLPTMVYGSFGIDLINRKSEQFDFYHPDFENLGLQPVLYSQFNNVISSNDKVVGYSARFIEYKQKLDLAHGLFADTFFSSLVSQYDGDSSNEVKRGADSDYVTNFDNSSIGTLSAQYVSPYSLDNIFDTLTDYSIYSDHFKCWLNVRCDMLQPMSVLGLPQLS